MNHIKLFEELDESLLTVDEMSDFFLEFLDTKDLKFTSLYTGSIFDSTGNKLIDKTIKIVYTIDKKYIRITDTNSLSKFSSFLNTLESICRRWNIDFNLYMGGFEIGGDSGIKLEVQQLAPKAITNWVIKHNLLTETFYLKSGISTGSTLDGTFKGYSRSLSIDEDMNFYLTIIKYSHDKTSLPPNSVVEYFEKNMGVKFVKEEEKGKKWKFKIPY